MSAADATSPQALVHHTVQVPATSANLGAGFDAFGLALDLHLAARTVARDPDGPRVTSSGLGAEVLPTDDTNLVWRGAFQGPPHVRHRGTQHTLLLGLTDGFHQRGRRRSAFPVEAPFRQKRVPGAWGSTPRWRVLGSLHGGALWKTSSRFHAVWLYMGQSRGYFCAFPLESTP